MIVCARFVFIVMGKKSAAAPLPGKKGRELSGFPTISQKKGLLIDKLDSTDIMTVDGVLSTVEAQHWVEAAESSGLFQHQGSGGAARGEAFRDNDRMAVQDPVLARHLWEATGLSQVMRDVKLGNLQAIGLNPNIRLYRYRQGQKFGKHVDDSVTVPGLGVTAYTLLIYLSGRGRASETPASGKGGQELIGGETVFYGLRGKKVLRVAPKAGMALLHLHGDDCLEHEAAEVKRGIKYILRSDVVYGPC